MADGFLSRWARRKEAVRKGEDVVAEPEKEAQDGVPSQAQAGVASPQASHREGQRVSPLPLAQAGEGRGEGAPASQATPAIPESPPTLADADALTADSDFTRFVRPDVAPDVKNAALKKLFADPHFNVMDGLDVYIDDYNKADPLPPEMLRRLAGAKFLNLFDDEEKGGEAATQVPTGEVADDPAPQTVAQSDTRTGTALPPADDHADPDLRLQQDDAPGPAGPGAGAG